MALVESELRGRGRPAHRRPALRGASRTRRGRRARADPGSRPPSSPTACAATASPRPRPSIPAPGDLHRALREAELVVEAIARDERIAEALDEGIAASGVYRLLFRALITDPGEVRSFYEDTVEPLVRYDRQYRSELLEHARGVPRQRLQYERDRARRSIAHRHTVAYRLDRIRELSGLDPGGERGPRAPRARQRRPTGSSRRRCLVGQAARRQRPLAAAAIWAAQLLPPAASRPYCRFASPPGARPLPAWR